MKTIFESFSQADESVTRKYGGTGLGLTISKQLTELQQGTIKVKSEEDKGSIFTVSIPYAIGSTSDVAKSGLHSQKNKAVQGGLKGLKVLLVEDNDINRLYASTILKTWGCLLEMAENGYVAIVKLKNSHFDIVLMDIQMPVMDGFEATKAIRAGDVSKNQIPIIALTANATKKDVEKCLETGMNDCISKPFTPEDLFQALVKHSSTSTSTAKLKSVQSKSPNLIGTPDLSYLRAVSNGNENFVSDMVVTMKESIPKSITEIQNAVNENDYSKLAKALHKIGPSLPMMGLDNLKIELVDIEDDIKHNRDHKSIPQRVESLCKAILKTVKAL